MSGHDARWAKDAGPALRSATGTLAMCGAAARTAALHAMADALQAASDGVLAANAADILQAERNGTGGALLDRLRLDPERLAGIAAGIRAVAAHPDPLGREMTRWTRPNGLVIAQVRVPIGAIGVIFESRPNVAADAAALCVRSGNAVVLRGGSDARRQRCRYRGRAQSRSGGCRLVRCRHHNAPRMRIAPMSATCWRV